MISIEEFKKEIDQINNRTILSQLYAAWLESTLLAAASGDSTFAATSATRAFLVLKRISELPPPKLYGHEIIQIILDDPLAKPDKGELN